METATGVVQPSWLHFLARFSLTPHWNGVVQR